MIDRSQLAELARTHRLVPLTRTLFADAETPVGVYRKLAGGRPGTFLLESAEPGASFSRWSFVGVSALATLTVEDGQACWQGHPPPGLPDGGDPLQVLAAAWRTVHGPRLPGLPPLTGGFVGYLSYDVVRRIETLPEIAPDELGLPELMMLMVTDLAAVDHHSCTVTLIANAVLHPQMSEDELDAAHADAERRLDAMARDLAAPTESTVVPMVAVPPKPAVSRTPPGEFEAAVEQCLEAIRAGEVFQILPGQRFRTETDADAFDVYRALRTLNPSPYLYYLHFADFDIVGSSPEALVTVSGDSATIHPIAGTRPRGADPVADAALVAELLADPKERAEHVMLVDLARNDLGRVCRPGTVQVVEFGTIERYSHVWHIVSTVSGQVAEGKDAFDVFTAVFPHGTVSGAPKVRAMQLLEEIEPVRRGIYAGGVGYFDSAGDMDLAIAIRTAVMVGGTAYVQAGAGVVADSIPANEEAETRNKARAVLQAIATAETLKP
ncbi:anthranilate synthase component I [Jatrophihabitans sp.]|uniref:anthranilate synthase component I n=1 Tax=Jatrophihabitans sp. TaxID=1932789 RepID=UPI002CB51944|nr:anthranilate synthase component I [Jatrophihabitans sp.]